MKSIAIHELEKQIHNLINIERRKVGLSQLHFNEQLSEIAREHSKDMAKNNYSEYKSQEEIAESTVKRWMNSPGHRKNILSPFWRTRGIGVAIASDKKVYVTENFC